MARITPNEIINKEFRLGFRGYATEQVDEFLQIVSDSLFEVMEENQRLRGQLEELGGRLQQYQQSEELIKNALVVAERTADEVRRQSHQEAELMQREAQAQLQQEHTAMEELRQARYRIITEMRAILNAHLSLLETQEGRLYAVPAGRPEDGRGR